jgi:hypothetical protein
MEQRGASTTRIAGQLRHEIHFPFSFFLLTNGQEYCGTGIAQEAHTECELLLRPSAQKLVASGLGASATSHLNLLQSCASCGHTLQSPTCSPPHGHLIGQGIQKSKLDFNFPGMDFSPCLHILSSSSHYVPARRRCL